MLMSLFIYLMEASICMAVFALAYRLFFSRLTLFQWNRAYLLFSLGLSLFIPFLPFPFFIPESGTFTPLQEIIKLNFEGVYPSGMPQEDLSSAPAQAGKDTQFFPIFGLSLLLLYLAGCLFKAWQFGRSLYRISLLIRKSPKEKKEGYYLVRSRENVPAFSFLIYIFLPAENNQLSKEDISQILQHEQVHVAQKHTWDLLLFELAGIFFWFNPVILYYKSSIREVHEYLVDATVSRQNGNIRKYGALLIKLATQNGKEPLLNTFSNKQIVHRIKMLTQTKSSPMQKFRFLFTLPVLALSLVLCSFLGNEPVISKASPEPVAGPSSAQDIKIRKISWLGNTVFSDAELNQSLGLKTGDLYDAEKLNSYLGYNPDGPDLSALYMDNGYLFFNVTPKEVFIDHAVDLSFTISEGPQARIGKVIIKGNQTVPIEELLEKIEIKEGELFSRAGLINAQKAIAQMEALKAESIQINPIPYQRSEAEGGGWLVDLEFVVEEK